jgi:CRP-like cAMP-binding protein
MELKYLTANDRAMLRSIARRVTYKPREIIIPINSKPTALFIVVSGTAAVEVLRGKPIAKLSAGDICGDMAFVENGIASASVVAETELEVDVLDLPQVTEIFTHYPHLETRFYKSLAVLLSQRMRSTLKQLSKPVS